MAPKAASSLLAAVAASVPAAAARASSSTCEADASPCTATAQTERATASPWLNLLVLRGILCVMGVIDNIGLALQEGKYVLCVSAEPFEGSHNDRVMGSCP